jgi:hypothetical protein
MLEHPRFQAFMKKLVESLRQRILALFARHEPKIQQFQQQVKEGATTLDRDLTELYPDRYPALKEKAGEAKNWYDQQIAEQKANPDRPLPADQNYRDFAQRMGELGQKAAQTEEELRSQIATKLRTKGK